MSTSLFLNFIKLLKNREQIDNKIKRLPYNAYYLTAKHIGGNYRFNEDGNIYYEDVVIDCNSRLGIVVRDEFIVRIAGGKIVEAYRNIFHDASLFYNGYHQYNEWYGNALFLEFYSNVFTLEVIICYHCGRLTHYTVRHGIEHNQCYSRRCINTYGMICSHCSGGFFHYGKNPMLNNFDCVCKEKYVDQELQPHFNLENLIRNIIALG